MKYLIAILLAIGLAGCNQDVLICDQQGIMYQATKGFSNAREFSNATQTCVNNADGTITVKAK